MSTFDRIADISLGYEAAKGAERDRIVLRAVQWHAIDGDKLPPALALLAVDFALQVNYLSAIGLLAQCVGLKSENHMNRVTSLLASHVRQGGLVALLRDFQARAMLALVNDPIWEAAAPQVADRLCGTLSIAIDWALHGDKNGID